MGRPEQVGDKEILRLFIETPRPVLGTGEVAELTGYETQHASRRLEKLERRGYLRSHKVGRVKVWWITYDGRDFVDA